jgi:cytoskeletal protein CcmA (bactofilin family)
MQNNDPSRPGGNIGKSIRIEGSITGEADLYIDGQVEGSVSIQNASVTVGPNGVAQADIKADEVTVIGKLKGKVTSKDRISIAKTGSLEGEVTTSRIAVEDGAIFRGSINIARS